MECPGDQCRRRCILFTGWHLSEFRLFSAILADSTGTCTKGCSNLSRIHDECRRKARYLRRSRGERRRRPPLLGVRVVVVVVVVVCLCVVFC